MSLEKVFIKSQKNLSASEIKETEKNLVELEKNIYNFKKYYDYDEIKYYGIRDTGNLFVEIDEDYYKPRKTKSAFNGNYTHIYIYICVYIYIYIYRERERERERGILIYLYI